MLRSLDVSRAAGNRRVWWVAAGLWAALIFVVSSIPSVGSSGDVTLRGAIEHMAEYLVLAALLRRCGLSWRMSMGVTLLYGLTDELHQAVVPGRDASVADLLFDAVGATLGAWLPMSRARR
jgi:VanZ family protein